MCVHLLSDSSECSYFSHLKSNLWLENNSTHSVAIPIPQYHPKTVAKSTKYGSGKLNFWDAIFSKTTTNNPKQEDEVLTSKVQVWL